MQVKQSAAPVPEHVIHEEWQVIVDTTHEFGAVDDSTYPLRQVKQSVVSGPEQVSQEVSQT